MGVEPKIGGFTPQIIHLFIGFSINYKPSILGVFPLFLETPISWATKKDDCVPIASGRLRVPNKQQLAMVPQDLGRKP